MKAVLLIILFTTLNLFAQDDAIKKLFPGKWKMDIENAEVYEEWELLSENELVGKSYSVKDGIKNHQ